MVRVTLCALALLAVWMCAHGVTLPAPLRAHSTIMLLIDPLDGRILDANEEAQRFHGYAQLGTPGTMRIQEINQLSDAEISAEIKRAAEQKRNFSCFRTDWPAARSSPSRCTALRW